jgi:hypothetical protein
VQRTARHAVCNSHGDAPYPATRLISPSDAGFSKADVSPELFAQVRGADNSAHDFCVSRFGNVADEQNFLGSERFAKLGGERVF